MRECDPADPLEERLIRTYSHMMVDRASSSDAHLLRDVLNGTRAVLEYIVLGPRQRQRLDVRRDFAKRIASLVYGQKEYIKIQMGRIETFACCVEALDDDVKWARVDIKAIKKEWAEENRKANDALAALTNPSISYTRLIEIAASLRSSALQERSVQIRDIGKKLYEQAHRNIASSSTEDEVVRKIVNILVKPARNDPGAEDQV